MTERFESWARLSRQDRIAEALRVLTEAELANLEPDLYGEFVTLRVRGADSTQLMMADLAVRRRIRELRQAGKMTPLEELERQATVLIATRGMDNPVSLFLAANRHGREHRRGQRLDS